MLRRTVMLNGALAVVLVAAGTTAYLTVGDPTAAKAAAQTVEVSRQTVTSAVSATGNVVSHRDLGLNFDSSSGVKVGQHVHAGQLLAKVDDRSARIALTQAQAQLTSAEGQQETTTQSETAQDRARDQASVAAAQVSVRNADTSLTDAQQQASLDRSQQNSDVATAASNVADADAALSTAESTKDSDERQLQEDQSAHNSTVVAADKERIAADKTQISADKASLSEDQSALTTARQQRAQTLLKDNQAITTARGQLATARSQLVEQQATSAADAQPATAGSIKSAEGSVEQSQSAVRSAELTLQETKLYAPADGTVASISAHRGEQVSSGSTSSGSSSSTTTTSSTSGFIVLTDLTGLEVTADFSEADAAKLHIGEKVSSSFSALTNSSGSTLTVSGTVEAIAVSSTVSSNVVEYGVTVSLDDPPSSLRVGQTANVTVTTGSASNVLAVPSTAISTTGPNKTVTVEQAGKQRVVTVTTGLVGDSDTEISSGLSAGEQVVISSGTSSTSTGVPGFPGGGGLGGGLGG
jgi:HlyD family secretion protein